MPLTSPPRKVSETENMLRLLLCVDMLESVTPAQLWTYCAEQELMDYVSMRLCLHKLLAAGELETGEGTLSDQLLLTDRGREALTLFGGRLPGDVRERVCASAPEFSDRMARNRQVRAAYEMARPEDYRLNLTVEEGDLPTLRLRMATASRTLASKALRRFTAHASQATTYLYGLAEQALNRRNEPGADRAALAVAPDAVTEHSAAEFTARVPVTCKKASFTVELLLPSRRAAEAFAESLGQPDESAAVASRLAEMLTAAPAKPAREARG